MCKVEGAAVIVNYERIRGSCPENSAKRGRGGCKSNAFSLSVLTFLNKDRWCDKIQPTTARKRKTRVCGHVTTLDADVHSTGIIRRILVNPPLQLNFLFINNFLLRLPYIAELAHAGVCAFIGARHPHDQYLNYRCTHHIVRMTCMDGKEKKRRFF